MSTKRKVWSSILIVIVILVGGFIYWFTWTGSTKDIEAVANQFKPDSSWKLVRDMVEPPATTCIDVTCPSLARTWETGGLLTNEEFQAALDRSGWDFKIDGKCDELPVNDSSRYIGTCSAEGVYGKYIISIGVGIDSSEHAGIINIWLELNDR